MMPLWMSTLGQHFTDKHIQIPFATIVEGLIGLMIPTSLGMLYTYYKPEHIKIIQKWIKVKGRFNYITAFIVSNLCRQSMKDCVTIAIETGIQNIGIAMLLMMWCLPEPESDISVTIIFIVAIMTDKPLVVIWLISRVYKKWCKKDQIDQIDADLKKQIPRLEIGEVTETNKEKKNRKAESENEEKYKIQDDVKDNELKQ
uniref:Na_H_Exchanger domain-containing protein n=1 Tax=Heterorhabditis bacteriophora TaxID=37862 RepID=A0A1I7XE06_HETBA